MEILSTQNFGLKINRIEELGLENGLEYEARPVTITIIVQYKKNKCSFGYMRFMIMAYERNITPSVFASSSIEVSKSTFIYIVSKCIFTREFSRLHYRKMDKPGLKALVISCFQRQIHVHGFSYAHMSRLPNAAGEC